MRADFGDYGGFETEVLDTVLTYDMERDRPSLYSKIRTENDEEAWLKDGVPVSQQAYAGASAHNLVSEDEKGIYDDMPESVADYFEDLHDDNVYDGILDAISGEVSAAKERYKERKTVMEERKPVAREYNELRRKAKDGLLEEGEEDRMTELEEELFEYAADLHDIEKDLGEIYADIADASYADEAADALAEYWNEMGDVARDTRDSAHATVNEVNEYVSDVLEDIDLSETANNAKQTGRNAYDSFRDRASEYGDRASDWTQGMTDRLRSGNNDTPVADGRGPQSGGVPIGGADVGESPEECGVFEFIQSAGEHNEELLQRWDNAKEPWSNIVNRYTADDDATTASDVMAGDMENVFSKITGGLFGSGGDEDNRYRRRPSSPYSPLFAPPR